MSILLPLVLTLLAESEAARILAVFPVPSISHQIVFRHLTQELAKRGHDVVVVTTDPAFPEGKTPANLTEIDFHDLSYNIWQDFYKVSSSGNSDASKLHLSAYVAINNIVEAILNTNEIEKIMKEKFDLLLLEACVTPILVLSHIFKVPVIQVSSLGLLIYNTKTVGAVFHPFLHPDASQQRVYNPTKWEKIVALLEIYKTQRIVSTVESLYDEMIKRKFGPEFPTVSVLKNNVDMIFANVHPIWEDNRPVPPSVVFMGGLHQSTIKELPEDLRKYLDSSKNGVIYISFGTNVKTSLLSPERTQMIVKVLSQLPYDVIWKWDTDELPGRTENIKISKWLPQSDLLRHPKIKVFITQAGLQSTDEAITAGVPLIGIPVFGDQTYNAEKYVKHGIGVKLDLNTFTENQLRDAINTVINDTSYRRNLVKLRDLMNDQPQRPLERAVWWTEHVLRHGGAKHLRAPAANMSWTEYLELELLLTLLAFLLAIIVTISILLHKIWMFLSKNNVVPLKIKSS